MSPTATRTARHRRPRGSSAPAASVRSPPSRPAAGPPPGRAGPATSGGDSTALSSTDYGDFELTTLVRFGGPGPADGGAGPVLLRASADAADGYAVSLDPNLRTVRLFRRDAGRSTVLAEVPLLVRGGTTLPLRIRARSTRIEVLVGDRTVIDTTDGTHRRGRIGPNVFGGRAAYQDTHVTAL
ncbi:hypothetical protein QC334_23175 [Streptomyces sp. DH18]|uniref:hypothetical protein n=1 Tax=Streptomyces sp. DH7 TaxID=2857006 RepID=UPI001E44293E|nr:hypothetical protein [Streptomyces sp. DH7]MDG9685597.1 hypothetical protein [Streptomyces sp. DH18]